MLPHFRRSYLVEDIPVGWEAMTRKLGCASFQFWHEKCSQEEIESCVSTGVPLYVTPWTLDPRPDTLNPQPYSETSIIMPPPPYNHHRTLGIVLL
jgi:hypothetical protein